jgi:hypothetical protein
MMINPITGGIGNYAQARNGNRTITFIPERPDPNMPTLQAYYTDPETGDKFAGVWRRGGATPTHATFSVLGRNDEGHCIHYSTAFWPSEQAANEHKAAHPDYDIFIVPVT